MKLHAAVRRNRDASVGSRSRSPSPIRIRTGMEVTRGVVIGNPKRPTAFVWIDENAAVPILELVIKGKWDYWWEWLWHDGRIADLDQLFPERKDVQRLVRCFDDWIEYYRGKFDWERPQRFCWGRFNEEGVALARRLQALVIDEAVIRYCRCDDEPQGSTPGSRFIDL